MHRIDPGMVITFPKTVTHHLQDDQLDLEFDSSADLIFCFVLHEQSVSSQKYYYMFHTLWLPL